MTRLALVALVLALPAGCTLLESRDGLVGPPLGDDPGDSGTVSGPEQDGAPATSYGVDSGSDGSAATVPDAGHGGGSDSGGDSGSTVQGDSGGGKLPTDAATGPVDLYTSLISPLGITLHGTDVCWVGGDQPRGLYCAPQAGGGTPRNLDQAADMTLLNGAFDLVVSDTDVYWSNGSANQVVHKPLPSGTSVEYYTGDGRLSYLALQGTQVYATDYSSAADAAAGNVVVGPSTGVMSTVIYPLVPGASGVAVLNATVFWGRATPNALAFGPQSGNATITTVPAGGAVTGVAVDAQQVTYFIQDNQKIMRVLYGANSAQLVYDTGSAFGVSDIAVDDTTIYWTEHDLGKIEALAK